ncbi:MAG: hypothetical protein ACRELF_16625, partial [Gemmataceae bacterium]
RRLRTTFAEPLCKTLLYPRKTPCPYELSNSIRNLSVCPGSNQFSSHTTNRTLFGQDRRRGGELAAGGPPILFDHEGVSQFIGDLKEQTDT